MDIKDQSKSKKFEKEDENGPKSDKPIDVNDSSKPIGFNENQPQGNTLEPIEENHNNEDKTCTPNIVSTIGTNGFDEGNRPSQNNIMKKPDTNSNRIADSEAIHNSGISISEQEINIKTIGAQNDIDRLRNENIKRASISSAMSNMTTKVKQRLDMIMNKRYKKVRNPEQLNDAEIERCLYCMTNQPDALFQNCGHGGLCYECSMNMIQDCQECHYCRSGIIKVLKINIEKSFKGVYCVERMLNVKKFLLSKRLDLLLKNKLELLESEEEDF